MYRIVDGLIVDGVHMPQLIPSVAELKAIRKAVNKTLKLKDQIDAINENKRNAFNIYMHEQGEAWKDKKRNKKENKKSGYIYIMLDQATSYVKIGWSTNPTFREKTLQSQKPSIILVDKFPGTRKEERNIHKALSDKRVRGEWFAVSPEFAINTIFILTAKENLGK
jgi:hypothetical protein